MNEAIDYSTLRWVKQELDETLKQARQALEAFVETPEDTAQMSFCAAHLHQVYGTLQMVELYGAALLAEEMEQVAKALLDDTVKQRDDAFGVLMRCILQLPDYLERLMAGGRDMPIVLLPLLNDLRAARGENLLSENTMFAPDLGRELPAGVCGEQDEALQELAKSLRHRYQVGLLTWYRDSESRDGLDEIAGVLDQLRGASADAAVARLCWIAGGLVQALRDEVLDVSLSTKLLLGQVDRQIKRLIDDGVAAFADVLPRELLTNLLFYVARSQGGSAQVDAIKGCYGLQSLLPDESELQAARDSLSGHNRDLMDTVAVAIKENLARVKDSLDLFQRGGYEKLETLQPVADTLKSLGDTLGMLGMGAPRKVVLEKAAITAEILDGSRPVDEDELMDVAAALLFVENALDGAEGGVQTQAATPEDAEFDQVMVVVLQEAIADMARAKEAVAGFIDSSDHTALKEVPQLFNQVKGGLLLLGREKAAALVDAVNQYVTRNLLEQGQVPDSETLNTLADAICGVEYYLEGQKEKRLFGGSVIEVAVESVARLGYPLPEDLVESTVGAIEVTEVDAGDAESGFETLEVEELEISSEAPAEEMSGESHESPVDAVVIEADFSNKHAAQGQDSAIPLVGEDIDEEILEIFIEESEEEVGTIRELLPRWIENTQDEEALVTVRRSFHTLKGSGRLVGAARIGEFAWAFENLFNRVIENTVQPDAAMFGVLGQCMEALPQLVEQVKGGPAPAMDITLLESQAAALSRGESLDSVVVETVAPAEVADAAFTPEPLAEEAELDAGDAAEPMVDVMDPVLYDIFYSETTNHLAVMREFTAACSDSAQGCGVTEELVRALHTLHGSARMADVQQIAEISSELERYGKTLMAERLCVPGDALTVLGDAADVIAMMLELLKHQSPEMPDIAPLLERIEALPRSADALEQIAEAPVDAMGQEEPVADDSAPEAEVVQVEGAVAAQVLPVIGSDVDQEILEVFIEEADEELASIGEMLPRWITDVSDEEALTTLRRSFHTLKGSGRLVGALRIGEFCWAVENLLNRVIDGDVAPAQPLFDLMQEVGACLPELVAQVSGGPEPQADVAIIEARTHAMSEGKVLAAAIEEPAAEVEEPAAEVEEPAAEVEEPAAEVADDPYADVDPELLEIFLEEADEILENCEATLVRWVDAPQDAELMAEYQRHLHTLKGGARMAEIPSIGDLSHGIETMLTFAVEGQVPVSTRMFDLLQLAQDRLAGMVEQVHKHAPAEPAQGLIAELESLLHDEADASPAVEDESTATVEVAEDPYIDVDPELLEIFIEEGDEILEASEGTLHRWAETPENFDLMAQFQRELHTLKGGARMANVVAVGDLAHGVESLVTVYSDDKKIPPKPVFDALHVAQDRLVAMMDHVRKHEAIEPAAGLVAELQRLVPGAKPVVEAAETAVEQAREEVDVTEDRRTASRTQQELVRVRADLLDNLVNYAGEISIYRSRLEQQVGSYRFNLAEMDQTILRLRQQLRQLEIETEAQILSGHQDEIDEYGENFDPLEMDRYSTLQQLSRSLAESVGDLSSIQVLLDNVTRESETLLLQQARVNTELQEGLMRTRMVPFMGLAPRMRRIVRQTCQELGKQAELKLAGAEGEMDRTVIDRIIAPIEHMLRNALAHGIEMPEQRAADGKDASGTIMVSMARESSEVVIRIEDDGRGISLEDVRRKAIERGLMREDIPLSDNEILQFILETGFSTAQEITQVSGRGVGMDVVNSEVKQLGGSLHIESELGKGTCFTIRLPFTLAINHALLVNAGEETYAIPLSSIEGIVRMRREDLLAHYQDPESRFEYAGYAYEVQHLGSVLGVSEPNLDALPARVPVLLARSGEHYVALHVDNLLGSREIVVKSVGPQISTVAGVSGATILGDGSVVLILDLAPLVRLGGLAQLLQGVDEVEAEEESTAVTVMVVDDSITVRKVTTRLLERNEMNVVSAKDGVDALAKLQEQVPDVMLLDIEMPRMDGFELATHIRNDARLKNIPIIMITSRTGDKHRNRAMEIGVNRYLGKPFQETDLLENIQGLLGETATNG